MATRVEKRILVNVPVSVAYNQWTQFEEFPQFMGGVKSVKQLSDDRLAWVAEIAGVRRQWQARILEQIPDRKVAWAATEGATNAGSVMFEDLGGGQTSIQLSLEYEPEGILEQIGNTLNLVEKQAENDLNRFKAFIEDEGYATGAWRGTVREGAPAGTPRNDAAADPTPAESAPPTTVPRAGTVGSVFPDEGIDPDVTRPGAETRDRFETTPFDQTNGLVDTEGDSDGTAASDTASAADRERDLERGSGTLPPAGGSLGQH